MNILSKMPERLKDLMLDKGLNATALANCIGVKPAAITRYLQGIRAPKFKTLIALVEFFNCSADFLLGVSDYAKQDDVAFSPVPPFSVQFLTALKKCGCSQYLAQKKTKISWATIKTWKDGVAEPSADNLVKLAMAMECSVDFLIGREK